MKKILEPVVMDKITDKGIVLTGEGVQEAKAVEVEYFNKDNDRSVFSICPTIVRLALERENVRKRLLDEEWELKKQIKPSPTLNRLRMSFWREFDRAQTKVAKMRYNQIYAGVCPREQFERYMRNDNYAIWLLKPPTDYVNSMEEALVVGIERLRELLEVPFYKIESVKISNVEFEDREVFDPKIADLVLKAVAMLDMRVKGALVQKVEQRVTSESKSIVANIEAKVSGNIGEQPTGKIGYVDIEDKIKQMEESLQKDVGKLKKPTFTKREVATAIKEGVRLDHLTGTPELSESVRGDLRAEVDYVTMDKEVATPKLEDTELFNEDDL